MSTPLGVIVFSKDRPLQLHGFLASLWQHWRGAFRVSVLVRETAPYAAAYREVYREFPEVRILCETDFARDLLTLLDDAPPIVTFACDDAVFVRSVDTAHVGDAFAADAALLGVSLRLGRTLTRGMFGHPMTQPVFLPAASAEPEHDPDRPSLLWDAQQAPSNTDWCYAWEVVGTAYPVDFVRTMGAGLVADGLCGNPSQLEHYGNLRWREHSRAAGRSFLRAWPSPRLVLPAVNVVQSEFPNGLAPGATPLPADELLALWQRGVRLDVAAFAHEAQERTWDTWRLPSLHLTTLTEARTNG